ncbi:MAG TPA: NAD(P)/FAD-dependent oxidoreductase [Polyangiaceae bacterium]|jgi:D-amino-acid oxidase
MEVDAAIIGGGVVGLACASALARAGKTTVVLEKFRTLGSVTTSRNSEVIHAGLYYAPGSLKATTCVRGAALLYAWCAERQVPHARCGKLVVATSDVELGALDALAARAKENGATVELVGRDRIAELEPNVRAIAALHSPSTGIVSSHALALSLAADVESHGGILAKARRVVAAEPAADRWKLACEGPAGDETVTAARVVNAAGLWADEIASLFGVTLAQRFMKGSYFHVKRAVTRALVYPLPPADGSLGIHTTVDLAGAVRLGPDAEPARSREDYGVDESRRSVFFEAASRYLQNLRIDDLTPDCAGIRPKHASGDFELRAERGVVHLAGIESPGLTAALALGERVAMLLS